MHDQQERLQSTLANSRVHLVNNGTINKNKVALPTQCIGKQMHDQQEQLQNTLANSLANSLSNSGMHLVNNSRSTRTTTEYTGQLTQALGKLRQINKSKTANSRMHLGDVFTFQRPHSPHTMRTWLLFLCSSWRNVLPWLQVTVKLLPYVLEISGLKVDVAASTSGSGQSMEITKSFLVKASADES